MSRSQTSTPNHGLVNADDDSHTSNEEEVSSIPTQLAKRFEKSIELDKDSDSGAERSSNAATATATAALAASSTAASKPAVTAWSSLFKNTASQPQEQSSGRKPLEIVRNI